MPTSSARLLAFRRSYPVVNGARCRSLQHARTTPAKACFISTDHRTCTKNLQGEQMRALASKPRTKDATKKWFIQFVGGPRDRVGRDAVNVPPARHWPTKTPGSAHARKQAGLGGVVGPARNNAPVVDCGARDSPSPRFCHRQLERVEGVFERLAEHPPRSRFWFFCRLYEAFRRSSY